MKRNILLICSLFMLFTTLQAQDYNFGFESWIDHGTYEEPEFWGTFNPVQFIGIQVIKDTVDVYQGNYSLKLSAGPIPAAVAVLGSINVNSALIEPGRPYSERPTKLKCYYKVVLVNNDSAAIAAFLTKYNTVTQQRDTIAVAGKLFYSDVTSWTLLDIDFDYNSTEIPDTLGIILSSTANPDGLGNEGCELYIDAMELVVPSSDVEEQAANNTIKIFPNPAINELIIETKELPSADLYITIYNVLGEKIYSQPMIQSCTTVSISNLKSGAYVISAGDISTQFIKD